MGQLARSADSAALPSAKTVSAQAFEDFDASRVASPSFLIDTAAIEANLRILQAVAEAGEAKVLLALKAYSSFATADLFNQYLDGACASGLYEARLAREFFAGDHGEVHTYSAGFTEASFDETVAYSDHLVFNSLSQLKRFGQRVPPEKKVGLRINPEHSEGTVPIYDPCKPCSRLGVPISQLSQLEPAEQSNISGLHFHTLCEQGFDALDRTLRVIEKKIPNWLHHIEWLNLGGGHHITVDGYDRAALIERLLNLKAEYGVELYLEPGEATTIDAGILIAEVQDVTHNNHDIAILDTSATCHMPDVIEMPYTPEIIGAKHGKNLSESSYRYVLGGPSCLAGDEIGHYGFDKALTPGTRLKFLNMAIYSIVKTNTFNGIPLPDIVIWDSRSDKILHRRQFSYEDFKTRLS